MGVLRGSWQRPMKFCRMAGGWRSERRGAGRLAGVSERERPVAEVSSDNEGVVNGREPQQRSREGG